MSADLLTAVIAPSGALIVAIASYWFTKQKERAADLRKIKLDHYKDFTAAISGIVGGDVTDEGKRAFARASNNLNLIAPQRVLSALRDFQDEIRDSNTNKDSERHDKLLSNLYFEIRRDLKIIPADDANTFRVGLWASSVVPKKSSTTKAP